MFRISNIKIYRMKVIEYFIIRPFIISACCALLFSFIVGTTDYSEWSTTTRIFHIILLLILFIENGNRYDKIKQKNKKRNMPVAPLSSEQIEKPNTQQQDGRYHPYTCMGLNVDGCKRNTSYEKRRAGETVEYSSENEGVLLATETYWICPCGKYKQHYPAK